MIDAYTPTIKTILLSSLQYLTIVGACIDNIIRVFYNKYALDILIFLLLISNFTAATLYGSQLTRSRRSYFFTESQRLRLKS